MDNAQALIDELQNVFSQKTLDQWCDILANSEGAWAPQFRPIEVLHDEQALPNGFVTPISTDDDSDYLAAASPGQFDEQPVGGL